MTVREDHTATLYTCELVLGDLTREKKYSSGEACNHLQLNQISVALRAHGYLLSYFYSFVERAQCKIAI